jgi:hypothetical protein
VIVRCWPRGCGRRRSALAQRAHTDPALPEQLIKACQITSDLLARKGQTGRVEHEFFRLAATHLRDRLWEWAEPDG